MGAAAGAPAGVAAFVAGDAQAAAMRLRAAQEDAMSLRMLDFQSMGLEGRRPRINSR